MPHSIRYETDRTAESLDLDEVCALFASVGWPHARVPDKLQAALAASEMLVTAVDQSGRLIGVANALGDGVFYAYIHWLIVHPDFQRRGIGQELAERLLSLLSARSQVFLFAEREHVRFWRELGFTILLPDDDNDKLIAGMRWSPVS